jgi:tetratricopeptide (TPR) repeat protein
MDPLPKFMLPPVFAIVSKDQVNAYATGKLEGDGPDAQVRPQVVVLRGTLDRVIRNAADPAGDADRLAFIVGHELSHVGLGHIVRPRAGQTEFTRLVFGRQQETAADRKGMELALKAGYSFRRGRTAIDRMKALGLDYSSFEGLGVDHPAWNDRLAAMDQDQAELWRAMAAFDDGVVFLCFEQYASAEVCFRAVLREFPQCPEAWTNLGDAQLMRYCDKLDANDLRGLGVGQPAVGAFYTRPESLEAAVRGVDRTLWQDAVEALQKALKLQPDLVLAQADLGVAFLVAPAGQDAERAARYLRSAAARAATDPAVDPLMRASVRVNAGAAELAAGEREAAAKQLAAAEKELRDAGDLPEAPVTLGAVSALLYNRALWLAASSNEAHRREAVKQFEQYLRVAPPASAWWPLAYEHYTKLCRALKQSIKTQAELARRGEPGFRPLTSVKLASGPTIHLSEPVREAVDKLGKGAPALVEGGQGLARWRYPEHGIDLLAADRVLAICLKGPKAPAVAIQKMGAGAETHDLRPNIARADLDKILAGEPYDVRQLDRPGIDYRFYPGIGLAARLAKGRVDELVIAQIPRKAARKEP